ncbi:MAG: hypothetical protein LBE78_12670, partial [Burkholderiaceae bacterium]|nr:hypothetical protein [Burkholderiaceae bacterium]
MRARPLAALLFGSVRAHADMIGTLRRLQAESGPLILAVLHDHGGGAERHVLELARLLRGQARFLVLRPTWSRRVSLRSADETEPLELHFRLDARRDLPGVVGAGDDCGDDYEALLTALRGLGVCHVHIHQRMGHSRAILDLPRRLGVSYDYTLHDYYPICPRITLSGGGGGGGAMAPPRSPASHGALPPEGAAPPWERPGDGAMVPPRSPASHGALPPEGAVPSWERPGDGAMVPPRSPAAHGALPPEGAVPSWERPGDGYCGEQGLGQCRACLPDGPDIVEWRDENAALILRARWVIAPSRDALARLLRYVPAATAVLVPHTDIDLQAPLPEPRPPTLEGGRPLRVAVIGALGVHKGAKVLEAAAVAAGKTGAPVEFHLLG